MIAIADNARSAFTRISVLDHIQSPIQSEKASRMSDRQWLSAMRRYSTDGNHRFLPGRVLGGAEELAKELQRLVVTDPNRFVSLLERMPPSTNHAYSDAILHGLGTAEVDAHVCARAIVAARRFNGRDFSRAANWLVEKRPELGSDSSVWEIVCRSAEHGDGAENEERFESSETNRSARELVSGNFDFEVHSLNEERGSAFEALAAITAINADRSKEVSQLIRRRIDVEPLICVRMAMMRAIGEIAVREPVDGLHLMRELARKDLRPLQCRAGRQLLAWAVWTRGEEVDDLITALSQAPWLSVRAWGLYLRASCALRDSVQPTDPASASLDQLHRRIEACAAAQNLVSGPIGVRASAWLARAFSDKDEAVRNEASDLEWEEVLDGTDDRSDLVRSFLRSPSFNAHHEGIAEALADRADRYRELAREALERLLPLLKSEREAKNRFVIERVVGRLLVNLYRAGEGNSEHEAALLDLFDRYLTIGLYSLNESLDEYERK